MVMEVQVRVLRPGCNCFLKCLHFLIVKPDNSWVENFLVLSKAKFLIICFRVKPYRTSSFEAWSFRQLPRAEVFEVRFQDVLDLRVSRSVPPSIISCFPFSKFDIFQESQFLNIFSEMEWHWSMVLYISVTCFTLAKFPFNLQKIFKTQFWNQ